MYWHINEEMGELMNDRFNNLSSYTPNDKERKLLSMGANHKMKPRSMNLADLNRIYRRWESLIVRGLDEKFDLNHQMINYNMKHKLIEIVRRHKKTDRLNELDREMKEAYLNIKNNKNIRVVMGDKGSNITLVDEDVIRKLREKN